MKDRPRGNDEEYNVQKVSQTIAALTNFDAIPYLPLPELTLGRRKDVRKFVFSYFLKNESND